MYIDEVEAVALRGASDTATTATTANGHGAVSGGEHREEANGSATGDGSSLARSDAAADSTDSPAPAFFDPLLNPGSGEGENPLEKAWSSAVVLLVPLRLGLDELSAGYIPSERAPKVFGVAGREDLLSLFFRNRRFVSKHGAIAMRCRLRTAPHVCGALVVEMVARAQVLPSVCVVAI